MSHHFHQELPRNSKGEGWQLRGSKRSLSWCDLLHPQRTFSYCKARCTTHTVQAQHTHTAQKSSNVRSHLQAHKRHAQASQELREGGQMWRVHVLDWYLKFFTDPRRVLGERDLWPSARSQKAHWGTGRHTRWMHKRTSEFKQCKTHWKLRKLANVQIGVFTHASLV